VDQVLYLPVTASASKLYYSHIAVPVLIVPDSTRRRCGRLFVRVRPVGGGGDVEVERNRLFGSAAAAMQSRVGRRVE